MAYIFLILYILCQLYLLLFVAFQFHLYLLYKGEEKKDIKVALDDDLPMISIQLPIYNERFVVERLVEAISKIDYPKERMQILLLDDSIDATLQISQRLVTKYMSEGYLIQLLHRVDRTGYKAGALQDALPYTEGDFVYIFDADFIPKPDIIKMSLPYFTDAQVGVVQTRWEHLNENYSLLTKLQSYQLNVHFTVEQNARQQGNLFLQFNGTAGAWRKSCIADAGGWSADTLTEDLDLSYRAQLKGWKIAYLDHIESPAELPAEMNSLKSQQFRWNKGGAETAKKILPKVWSSEMSIMKKMHASLHLLSSSIFLIVFLNALLTVPIMLYFQANDSIFNYLSMSFILVFSMIIIFYEANVIQRESITPNNWVNRIKFLFMFPVFFFMIMGLSFHNSLAVIQGWLGMKSPFIRTPKFALMGLQQRIPKSSYIKRKLPVSTIGEGFVILYFGCAVMYSLDHELVNFLFLHIMLMLGFASIFVYSIIHLQRN